MSHVIHYMSLEMPCILFRVHSTCVTFQPVTCHMPLDMSCIVQSPCSWPNKMTIYGHIGLYTDIGLSDSPKVKYSQMKRSISMPGSVTQKGNKSQNIMHKQCRNHSQIRGRMTFGNTVVCSSLGHALGTP